MRKRDGGTRLDARQPYGEQGSKIWPVLLILFLATIASRIPFRSSVLYHWDSVQYALATEHYDISVHQPHPPGYFLYVMLGKVLNVVTNDANASFVIISIIASGGLVAAVYALSCEMFNKRTALTAALLAMTSPLVWFHGEVALNYIVEGFLSVLFACFCWKTLRGQHMFLLAASLVLAFAGGIRQTTLLFLFPLWAYVLWRVPVKHKLAALMLLLAGVLSWSVPMVISAGGYGQYMSASQEYRTYVVDPLYQRSRNALSLFPKKAFAMTIYGLGLSCLFLLAYFLKRRLKVFREDILSQKGIFFGIWTLPSIAFFIFLKNITNPGYILIYLPAFLIVAARAMDDLSRGRADEQFIKQPVLAAFFVVVLFFNTFIFIFNDNFLSYGFIRKQREHITAMVKTVRDRYSPGDTVLLARQYVFFGPRHWMYYLPEYRVYVMDDNGDVAGKRRQVFWGEGHRTHVAKDVRIPPATRRFITHEAGGAAGRGLIPKGEVLLEVDKAMAETVVCYSDIKLAPRLFPQMQFVWGDR